MSTFYFLFSYTFFASFVTWCGRPNFEPSYIQTLICYLNYLFVDSAASFSIVSFVKNFFPKVFHHINFSGENNSWSETFTYVVVVLSQILRLCTSKQLTLSAKEISRLYSAVDLAWSIKKIATEISQKKHTFSSKGKDFDKNCPSNAHSSDKWISDCSIINEYQIGCAGFLC